MSDLTTHAPVDDDHLALLRDRLAETAIGRGEMDIFYRTVDSPLGSLLLVSTPTGVARVAFEREDHDAVLDDLSHTLGPRVLPAASRLDDAASEVERYFAGRLEEFTTRVDLILARGFRLVVLNHLQEIPYGATESYAQVAAASGSPRAVRAAGTACATNPVPVFVPCHRVVRSDGSTGAYRGGAEAKQWILDMEHEAARAGRHTEEAR